MAKSRANPQNDSLGFWAYRLHQAMHSSFSEKLALLGVTAAEWTVLCQADRGGMTPVILADYMRIDRAAVTRIIDQLEAKELVRRTPHPKDGRSTVLELTAKGSELLPKLIKASKEVNQTFDNLLSPEDSKALLRLMKKLGEKLPQRTYPYIETPGKPSNE